MKASENAQQAYHGHKIGETDNSRCLLLIHGQVRVRATEPMTGSNSLLNVGTKVLGVGNPKSITDIGNSIVNQKSFF